MKNFSTEYEYWNSSKSGTENGVFNHPWVIFFHISSLVVAFSFDKQLGIEQDWLSLIKSMWQRILISVELIRI